jgi:hypothetical protein
MYVFCDRVVSPWSAIGYQSPLVLLCSRWIACNLRLPSSGLAAGFGNPAGAESANNTQEGDYPQTQLAVPDHSTVR